MEQMSKELISKIEKALNIKFYEWQRKYLLNEPMLLDMRMTGRCTGKTLVHIIKQLFESSEPLLLRSKAEILDKADWWCIERRRDRALGHHYLEFYKRELKGIHEKLNEAGIVTREVIYKYGRRKDMKYKLELNFNDKPKCSSCMLSGTKGLDLNGETVMCCYALGNRPKCPEEGHYRDCPLAPSDKFGVESLADYLIEHASGAFEHQNRELLESVLKRYFKE